MKHVILTGKVNNQAFVSLATNNGYALGALVLGNSLRSVNTNRQMALMITREVDPQVRYGFIQWNMFVNFSKLDVPAAYCLRKQPFGYPNKRP